MNSLLMTPGAGACASVARAIAVISNVKDTFLRILIGLPFSLIVIADYCGVILQYVPASSRLWRYKRTYSKSKGWRLVPVDGGAIQLAIFPRSATCVIRLRTYSR